MMIKEGLVPTALGTIVTAAGATLIARKMSPAVSAGILGFGLAHIVLGSIDLVEHKHKGLFG
ncbi:hypothetical protein [Clostridium akagii]|uniref:hypothetical protein n=1 Tax=Clostridium akagii TaxID=91623 RepID=UPI0004795BDA|nr:hypothetical protein [Clostridium akagii]